MAVRTLAEDVVPGGDLDVIVVSLPGGVGHLGGVAALGHLGSLLAVLTTQAEGQTLTRGDEVGD